MPFEAMPKIPREPVIPWEEMEKYLDSFVAAKGGHSNARRGIIVTPDQRKVFIKIGVDEHTKNWAAKEIQSYAFLEEHHYPFIPNVVSTNPDKTGFAIEGLLTEDGWDWTDTWSKERLEATLEAMDALAAIKPESKYAELLKPVITDAYNGWPKLAASAEQQSYLESKIRSASYQAIPNGFQAHMEKASGYRVRHDTLIHGDVRADNCAWNQATGEVKLVDWNWFELGDQRLDVAAFLVHVQQKGFDVLKDYSGRLDAQALHWLAGYWLECASKPIWPGGPEKLRDLQLLSGITSLKLAQELGI